MRIALVIPHAETTRTRAAGRGEQISPLAEALARLGHEVTIYAPDDPKARPGRATAARGVTIRNLPAPVALPPAHGYPGDEARRVRSFSDQLARCWQQEPPDVAHAHFWTSGLAALAGARGLDVPVVQTFHSLGTPQPDDPQRGASGPGGSGTPGRVRGSRLAGTRRPAAGRAPGTTRPGGSAARGRRPEPVLHLARLRLEVSLARNVGLVLATSSEEMAKLTGMGVPRGSIRVVPWGVDTVRFAPDGPVARRNGRPRLLVIGQPGREQGLDLVIRSLAEVPAAELLIARGPAGPRPAADAARPALARLARDLGVADRISFAGEVSADRLPALLRSADLLLSGDWEEPSGAVALAAMACGTPVAAAATGAVSDAVIDGTTGILVPPGRPSLLARRIRLLLASPLQLDAFSVAAVDRARSRYSWDRIGRETVRAYERCLPHQLVAEPELETGESEPEYEPEYELAGLRAAS
jgi:glycosyltransferase involved in cell wall biosynthesis